MKLLILGGSGQLSRRVAELALDQHHDVWTLTRGLRPLPSGVHALTADRKNDAAFRAAIEDADTRWDACIDCTGRTPQTARQCVEILSRYTRVLKQRNALLKDLRGGMGWYPEDTLEVFDDALAKAAPRQAGKSTQASC